MLTIDTKLGSAGAKGIGLFAVQNIKAGDTVWVLEPVFHKVISVNEYQSADPLQKIFLDTYSTYHACGCSGYFLDLDNTRFINHSVRPNIEFDEEKGIALRDIHVGEEIVCDYGHLSKAPEEKELGFTNMEYTNKVADKVKDVIGKLISGDITMIGQNLKDTVELNTECQFSLCVREFKKVESMSIYDYYLHMRISRVKELLDDEENYTIENISELANYSSINHLCHHFKKYMNMTPSGYRKSRRHK